jgi:hypothetical protein
MKPSKTLLTVGSRSLRTLRVTLSGRRRRARKQLAAAAAVAWRHLPRRIAPAPGSGKRRAITSHPRSAAHPGLSLGQTRRGQPALLRLLCTLAAPRRCACSVR